MSLEPQEDQITWAMIMDVKLLLDPDLEIIVKTETNSIAKNETKIITQYEENDDTNMDLVKVDQDLRKACPKAELESNQNSDTKSEAVESEVQQMSSGKTSSLHKCYHCKSTFKHKGQLFHHEQVKHPDTSELTQHIEKDGGLYICKTCSKTFPSISLSRINKHLKLAHKVGADIQCFRCSKVFVYKWQLKIHQDVHDKVKKVVCDLCGRKLCDKYAMKNHRLYIHGSHDEQTKRKKYQCEICKKGFYLESLLTQHKQVHGEKNILCHQCDESYRSKHALSYHVKTKHLGEIHVFTEEMKVRARIGAVKRRAMAKIKSKDEE